MCRTATILYSFCLVCKGYLWYADTSVRHTYRRLEIMKKQSPKRMEFRATAGSKGGKAAAARMTAEERKARAKKAIAARWGKKRAKRSE